MNVVVALMGESESITLPVRVTRYSPATYRSDKYSAVPAEKVAVPSVASPLKIPSKFISWQFIYVSEL